MLIGILCIGLLPTVQAVVPPPDGGYPGFTTAEGTKALQNLTSGVANTGVGWYSLFTDTSGSYNTAVGAGALDLNTGDNNTATGAAALLLNTAGHDNTANGVSALALNNTGSNNTAIGDNALFSNTNGLNNTAVGFDALFNNTAGVANTPNGSVGSNNTAVGFDALFNNTAGVANTAVGWNALFDNTTGNYNTAIGLLALSNSTSGVNNVALGFYAGNGVITANNVICIGTEVAGADVSNTAWIGAVYGVTTQNGTTAPVVVSADGQLGTVASSERFKKDIATMETASEVILSLRPVTFHYKTDATGTPQFGLIAEEVAKVNPALVLPDKEGKPYTVRYEAVNAMLLNEFLKEHREVAELKSTVAEQRKGMEAMAAQLKEQASQIQKVSAQLNASKPAPQVAENNQ